MKKLIHKTSFEGDRSVSGVANASSKNTQDLFSRYQSYWTDGWGQVGEFPQMGKSFFNFLILNYFKESSGSKSRFFDLNHPLLKNNLNMDVIAKMIQDLGNFIIKEWWFNGKKFKSPGDEYVMKIITILYPAMCFKEQANSCAIITTRYIGQDQLKVDIEHDPMDCYGGDGSHSDRYYDEEDQVWEFDNEKFKLKTMK